MANNKAPRLADQTVRVMAALLSSPQELSGAEIARAMHIANGSLYPILRRLKRAGWLAVRNEIGNPRKLGRPLNRYYRVTPQGEDEGIKIFNDLYRVVKAVRRELRRHGRANDLER